jgi:hypothetical protein
MLPILSLVLLAPAADRPSIRQRDHFATGTS